MHLDQRSGDGLKPAFEPNVGLRGCYVYFIDAPTQDFFVSRTERPAATTARAAEKEGVYQL